MAITKIELFEAIRAEVSLEFSHIPTEEESIDHRFSPRFMKRMLRLFRNQKRFYWKFVNAAGKRVAVILIAIAILFATACSIKPIREPIMRFITEVYETFTSYFFEGESTDKIEQTYSLGKLPEGFTETSRNVSDTIITTKYENGRGDVITVTQAITEENQLIVDREDKETVLETIDGVEVMIYDKGDRKQAMFIKEPYYFQIVCIGDVDLEVLKQLVADLQ